MKRNERGFTLIEILVVMSIVALIGSAAAMATFQVINVTRSSNDNMTVIRQAQNAGYWISHDALMAEYATVGDNPDSFLALSWTEWSYVEGEDSIYHTALYTFQDLSDGIGKLLRTHWVDAVATEQTLVAEYIYYNEADPDTTKVISYVTPVLTLQITSSFGEAKEVREYTVKHRPDF